MIQTLHIAFISYAFKTYFILKKVWIYKRGITKAEEMAPWLRVFANYSEDPSSIPRVHFK